jgi:TP901 family phage tail tape measure protein
MSQALRSLLAIFDVDTGAAEAGLKNLDKKIESTKTILAELAGNALAAFSAHAVGEFLSSMIELGSELNDTSERLGVSTDELQKFQYAAKLSGIGAEEASNALRFLNKNIGEAITGNADAAQTFQKLDVTLKDSGGNVRELGDIIPEVADAFAKMGSDQERTALAMKIFGRSGAQLIPLLKQGSGAIGELNKQFEELGLGIDEDFIKKADAAGDAIDTTKFGFRALKTTIAVEVLPQIQKLAEILSRGIAAVRRYARETNVVKEGWVGMGIAAAVAAAKILYGWGKVAGILKGGSIFENLFKLGTLGLVVGLLLLVAGAIEDVVVMCQGGESIIGDFLDEFLGVEEKKKLVDELVGAWEAMKPALDDLKPLAAGLLGIFAQSLPYIVGAVTDLVKGLLAAALALKALGSLAASSLAASAPGEQDAANDKFLKDSDAIQKLLSHSTLMDMVNAPAKTTATSGSGDFIGPPAPSKTENGVTTIGQITVIGGPTNADTAAAVADGVATGASRRAAATSLAKTAPSDEELLNIARNTGGASISGQ